jgi:two-component system phosphate regulon response regulator OmpR
MPSTGRIVVCDDEAELRATVAEYLGKRGYRVEKAADGVALDALMAEGDVAAVILDVHMPGEDGLSILRRIRASHRVGVIMLTAAGELVDRIVGLELGADDYLAKPVAFRELEARLRSLLRRMAESVAVAPSASASATPPVAFAGFLLDRDGARLTGPDGAEVALTPLEFRLLRALVENPGRVLNRDQLLEMAHDRGWDPLDRSIDIRISRIRAKIEENPRKPRLIRTVRGLGYMFDPQGCG